MVLIFILYYCIPINTVKSTTRYYSIGPLNELGVVVKHSNSLSRGLTLESSHHSSGVNYYTSITCAEHIKICLTVVIIVLEQNKTNCSARYFNRVVEKDNIYFSRDNDEYLLCQGHISRT